MRNPTFTGGAGGVCADVCGRMTAQCVLGLTCQKRVEGGIVCVKSLHRGRTAADRTLSLRALVTILLQYFLITFYIYCIFPCGSLLT